MGVLGKTLPILILGLSFSARSGGSEDNLIANGGFERIAGQGASNWSALWTRRPGAGRMVPDGEIRRSGKRSARIEHTGREDWSLNTLKALKVTPGDLFALKAWVRIEGEGSATICVTVRDEKDKVLNWTAGGRMALGSRDWSLLESRFAVPRNGATILPRVIGSGSATVWVDDFSLVKWGNLFDMRPEDMPDALSTGNASISVTLHTRDATLSVTDRRTGHTWRQKPVAGEGVLTGAEAGGAIEMTWYLPALDLNVHAALELEERSPEFTFTLSAEGRLEGALPFPHPFASETGTYLVVPMNEGISYPVEDRSIEPVRLVAYGGHGICMAFFGVTDGEQGHMAIIETPDDAAIRIRRLDDKLVAAPEWDAQKGRFGYDRKLRYVFFEKGGHVAICKRYRAHAREAGLLETLGQKRRENPHVDLLLGAVNVWYWENDALAVVREMKSLGIERILWSRRAPPEVVKAMNGMGGILTSRYDIYQDLMDPEVVEEKLQGLHPDWTQGGWPKDLMIDERGRWRRGWHVKGKDGGMYPCGVLCDRQAVSYARRRVPAELETHPYRCRFIDTTTASPWRECYHPDHPMTRSESRRAKMELLRFMSDEMKLVTGSETGHDAAVPFVHYFEGMLSLGPYRVPAAGRNMMEIIEKVPERLARFQVGHEYRLPLWELVFHDCVVAQWYWGDYNNKLPALWDKRDLFNILYGTPPMFMFTRTFWERNKARFVQSYENVCPVARSTGGLEMIDHRFLTPGRDVQQTVFADGTLVTVNFGEKPYRLPGGGEVAPMGFLVSDS